MKPSLFLNQLTIIDHAYIGKDHKVHGNSFNPSFIVSGEVDPHESVIVDFSTIKKDIKLIIDNHDHNNSDNGLDHKLIVLKNSYNDIVYHNNIITIKTDTFETTMPCDAVKVIEEISNYSVKAFGDYLEVFLKEKLTEIYPLINIDVKCNNSEAPVFYSSNFIDYIMFRYVHGLKNSTSYGCQNANHGHLSYIQSIELYNNPELVAKIKADIDDCIFIFKENIIEEDVDTITIEYTTVRGLFRSKYYKKFYKIIILPTETTVEFLAMYIKERYMLTEQLYVSEGLSKGAMI